MHITEKKLKEILVGSGIVTEATFQSAKDESMRLSQRLPDVLIGRGDVTEEYFLELLEPYSRAPVVDLRQTTVAHDVLELISESYAKSKGVVLFELDKERGVAKLAMTDPLDFDTIEFLRAKLGAWIEPYATTSSSLHYGLKQYKKKIGQEFNEIVQENVQKVLGSDGEASLSKLAEAVPIVAILDSMLEHAVALNASDIHFEPMEKDLLVRYRVDGILHEILSIPKVTEPMLVARVKVLAGLQIDEHRAPQDGRFRFEMEEGGNIDIRVNIMPVLHGEKVEMRILRASARPLTLEELGFSKEALGIMMGQIEKPHGMILVTGPTGHGKTTTLYAVLHLLNTPRVNITTIEDPIEYEIARVNQTQVNPKAGITFANGLRSLMRQNPDIIMVGEIRDKETTEIAVHAALTGHLVLSSLHTNDAPSALPRLLDLGAPAFLLSSTVNCIVAQRLVRRICSSCVQSIPVTKEIQSLIAAQLTITENKHVQQLPKMIFRGQGCKVCGQSGFSGQIGVFEVLPVTETIRALLLNEVPVADIRRQAIKEGMTTMFEDGLKKVERGVTTIEEVLRVVHE